MADKIPHNRGITRDEATYPDPETFNPDRWLLPQYPTYREPLTTYPNLNGYSQFGFGRRTCQGLPIVEQDLFLTMGGMAWALDIRKKRDSNGNEVPVHWDDYTPLLIAKPVKFAFDAVVRDAGRMRAVCDMVAHMDGKDIPRGPGDALKQPAGDRAKDFFVKAPDTPPQSPTQTETEKQLDLPSIDEPHHHPALADKRKRGSVAGTWHSSVLVAPGPIVVR